LNSLTNLIEKKKTKLQMLFIFFLKGDEILGVNNKSVKGKTKVEVARMIQAEAVSIFIYFF
jgi:hypothetical protein